MELFENAKLLKKRGFNDTTTIILKPFDRYTVRAPDGFESDYSCIKCKLKDFFEDCYLRDDLKQRDTFGVINTIVSRNIVIVEFYEYFNSCKGEK